ALVVPAPARRGRDPPRQHEVEGHPQLAPQREQRRHRERAHRRRRQELEAVGQRMQPAAVPDEDLAETIVGAHQPVLDAEAAAQRERPRLLRQEGVGPRLDEKAVHALADDGAAEPLARLDQRELERRLPLARHLHRAVRRRQPRDAAADDDELHAWLRTISASMATNSGWALTAGARWSAMPWASAMERASTSRS